MKKILSLALALALTAGLTVNAYAAEEIIGQALEALETEKRRRAEAAARGDYRIR